MKKPTRFFLLVLGFLVIGLSMVLGFVQSHQTLLLIAGICFTLFATVASTIYYAFRTSKR